MFDLDGTLLDTLEDLADSTNAALGSLGYPPHVVEAYRYFVGDGVAKMAERALPDDKRDEDTVAKCVAAVQKEYAARWRDKTRPYDGILDMLDVLDGRAVRMTILSNKPHDATQRTVEAFLPRDRFAAVVGARPSWPRKPDPAAAVDISRQLGIAPGEFLYLGDTNTDMKTARTAGMFAVGALWGFRTADELLESGAQALVEKPGELPALLDG